nr:retinaldehyde-binding protein 1-like [Dermacentor andersoni]
MSITCDKNETEVDGPPKDLETLAMEELGETPEVKRRCLAQLLQLLEGERNLRVPEDDAFLLMFLRTRKYRVNDAFKRVKNYFRVRKQIPEYFEDLNPSSIPYQTVFKDHKLILSSKKRDPLRRAAGYVRFGAWNSEICSINELMRCLMVAIECNLLSEETQIRGAVFVIDMEGFNTHHLITLSPWFLHRAVTVLQESGKVGIPCPPVKFIEQFHAGIPNKCNNSVKILVTFVAWCNCRMLGLRYV